jgi:hypothetical protein
MCTDDMYPSSFTLKPLGTKSKSARLSHMPRAAPSNPLTHAASMIVFAW